jgi:transcriptional regulator with XRE-family HTH domain
VDHRAWLQARLDERRAKNPRYSLRAFAKSLGVSPATLSGIMNGRRPFSARMARQVADALELVGFERQLFLDPASTVATAKERVLREDELEVVCDWTHYAVLSLAAVDGCRADPAWIGPRLGLPADAVRAALDNLVRMKLLSVESDGALVPLAAATTTTQDVPSEVLRRFHAIALSHVGDSLARDPIEERDVSTLVMAIDPRRLGEAKQLIGDFRRALCRLLETGERCRVYSLSIGLIPVGPGIKDDEHEEVAHDGGAGGN